MKMNEVCRTCLGKDSLNPIFVNKDKHVRYSTALYITTGVKVELDDGLSQKMCTNCINFLNSSLKFRKQCKETEKSLLKFKEQNEITIDNSSNDENDHKIDLDVKHDIKSEDIDETVEIKHEYTDYEILDEDDRPLKQLVSKELSDDELTIDDIVVSINNQEENTNKTIIKEIKDETNGETEGCLYEVDYNDPRSKRVTCRLCHKNLSIRSFDSHLLRRHPGVDRRKIKCDLCDSFLLKDKLNRHKKLMHGVGTYNCGYCKSEFKSKEDLIEHGSVCAAKKDKRNMATSRREMAECDICHKTMQKASLRMHQAIKHAGLGPVCEHCGKRFGSKFRLDEHYRAKHGYEKFKCSYCDFRSAAVVAMRNHERRHRGEKPFVCETCGAKFHAAYLLSQHKQSHRTEKLLKCNLCPATFKANNGLHMHKLTCHSSALYRCGMCPRSYRCRHYVVKHMRHVHHYRGPVPRLQRLAVPDVDRLEADAVADSEKE